MSDKGKSVGLEPLAFVQHFLMLKLGRNAHIDEKAVTTIPVGLKM